MHFLMAKPQSSITLVGVTLITWGLGSPAISATFDSTPRFDDFATFSTTIPRQNGGGDQTDVYYPLIAEPNPSPETFPIAILLQGALVDKADYSNFAGIVARYGFGVVVPNHVRTLTNPVTGESFTNFFPEQQQVNQVLDHMVTVNADSNSPAAGLFDPDKLVLLGHSFGGAVGLSAIQGVCTPFLCEDSFDRPTALRGGVFYGASLGSETPGQMIPSIFNHQLPIGLVAGDLDGVIELSNVLATYQQIQDPPKALVAVLGANHYGVTNQDNLLRDPIRPTLDQAIATETIARWSALFLQATALEDSDAAEYVFEVGNELDGNVNVVSEIKKTPEPGWVMGLLGLGMMGVGSFLKRYPQSAPASSVKFGQ